MNLSIIIPNYNGEKLLQKNLPKVLDAVREYSKGRVEIIVADDPSTDKSHQVIKDFIENIKNKHIIGKTISNKNKKEAGFSKNVNRGVSLATGEILILLNSDVAPYKDFLTPLLSYFSDPEVFAVGCIDESIENGKKVFRGRGVGFWKKGFFIHSEGQLNKDDSLWVSGGSGAFRRTIWNKLKGLDILYNPFYWEDIDISYRALKAGYKICLASESIVIHEHEKGAIKSKFKPIQIQKTAYRNQFIFIWKNITDVALIFSHIFWLPYNFLSALRRNDWAFFTGFFQALLLFPKIMNSRENARKLFITTDKKIIKNHSE